MCNHYRQAILRGETIPGWSIDQFSEIKVPLRFHNLLPDVFPDREGLVIRLQGGQPTVETMRWGFPPPPAASPVHVTNVRNTKSAFWRPWLKEAHRCLVPVDRFAEPDPEKPRPRAERWFARPDGLPMFFAGIWREWDGDRGPISKPVKGPHLLFSFLTTEPNDVVSSIHPKAMPVIVAPEDAMTWLTASMTDALTLQRPAPHDAIVLLPREDGP
jgi:putative SOS response-associated peptidase YedK